MLALGGQKGGSTIHIVETMRPMGSGGIVIAVDTGLGSSEHWEDPGQYRDLLSMFGYPKMSMTFLANIVADGLQSHRCRYRWITAMRASSPTGGVPAECDPYRCGA